MMTSVESWTLSYVLNSLWQVPLVFAAAWLAARVLRSLGAAAEHRVWVSALLLESLLPALSTLHVQGLPGLVRWVHWSLGAGSGGAGHVTVGMGPGALLSSLSMPSAMSATVTVAYFAGAVYLLARFAWRCASVAALRRAAREVQLSPEAARCWARCAERFGIADAQIAASSNLRGPATVGIWNRLVLLPEAMVHGLPEQEWATLIAHEFAHMGRHDFAKNLLYELVAVPVTFHPVLRLTLARVSESREMVCDEMAAQLFDRSEYGRSLLRLAALLVQGASAKVSHAIGLFDANTFERRVMKLTERQTEMRGVRRLAVLVVAVCIGGAACGSTLALGMNLSGFRGTEDGSARSAGEPLKVSSGVMAGNNLTKVQPLYPESAKKAKIQGTVVLHAIIGKDGTVEKLDAVAGPAELRASSLDAVRQWTYKPFLLNGEAVEVETTVNVTYTLGQ